jgi:tRNA modification GTPase
VIVVVNKADRSQRIERAMLQDMWPSSPLVSTSTLTGEGLSELEETLAELVLAGKMLHSASVLVTSVRHQEALRRAAEHLRASQTPLEHGLPLDFVAIDLRAAYDALGEVTGETASDDLLDRIFHEFCIGK